MKSKQSVVWIIQANQTTPIILDYLKTLKTRVERYLDLTFWVPESSKKEFKRLKDLEPVLYKTRTKSASVSEKVYLAKRQALDQQYFSQGLLISDALLHDDLGGGNTQMTMMEALPPKTACGILLQIPSPLGSSEIEERNFHTAVIWARQHQIPIIGYELLPLDTQWTLAPSMLDGVITRYKESYDHLKDQLNHNHIWLLPDYEACMFTSVATQFQLNGVKASYHYKNKAAIPPNRTVLYIPHNVAMIHEYKELIKILSPLGKKLHLMISVGKDQIRGTHTHEQMIKLVCKEDLKEFASHSFHNVNNPWEMMLADAVVASNSGLNTMVAEKELPCILFDPHTSEMERGNKIRVKTPEKLLSLIKNKIKLHQHKFELADILMLLATSRKNNA